MATEALTTLGKRGTFEFTEKKSVFIGYAAPVSSEAEALAFVAEIKAKHSDARHNVSAYVVGGACHASDDGEPQGTGGVPVLNVINGAELTNVCCVVTRYFGGTLLGVGGLVRAYSEGAKIAVQAAKIKIMAQSADFLLRCGYDFFGKLEYYLNEHGVLVLSTQFGEDVSTAVRIRKEEIPAFEHGITELSSGKLVPQLISDGWNEM